MIITGRVKTTMIEKWQKAQALEAEHWLKSIGSGNGDDVALSEEKASPGYEEVSAKIMRRLGFNQDDFAGKVLLDIGAGPTSRIAWLNADLKIAIDPLYDAYKGIGWAQLGAYDVWHSSPAEEQLPLAQFVDGVFCINCLDHCYEPQKVIANASAYCRDGAAFALSVDIGEESDDMHPSAGLMLPATITQWLSDCDFSVLRFDLGQSYPTPEGGWLDGWGGDMAAHWVCARRFRD